jgi:hypothetical protein
MLIGMYSIRKSYAQLFGAHPGNAHKKLCKNKYALFSNNARVR